MGLYIRSHALRYDTMKLLVVLALVGAACAMPVDDAPEVAAAKTSFQAAWDAAAAAAEAAPDFDLDGKLSTYSGYLSMLNGRLSPHFTRSFPYYNGPVVAAGAPLAYTGLGYPGYFGNFGVYPGVQV